MGIKRFRNGAWEEIGATNRIIEYSGSGFKNVMKQEKEDSSNGYCGDTKPALC